MNKSRAYLRLIREQNYAFPWISPAWISIFGTKFIKIGLTIKTSNGNRTTYLLSDLYISSNY